MANVLDAVQDMLRPHPKSLAEMSPVERKRIGFAIKSIPKAREIAKRGLTLVAFHLKASRVQPTPPDVANALTDVSALLHKHFTARTETQLPGDQSIPWLPAVKTRLLRAADELAGRELEPNFQPASAYPADYSRAAYTFAVPGAAGDSDWDLERAIFFNDPMDRSPFVENRGTTGATILHECWHLANPPEEQLSPTNEPYAGDAGWQRLNGETRRKSPAAYEYFCFEALFGTDALKWYRFEDPGHDFDRPPFVDRDGTIPGSGSRI